MGIEVILLDTNIVIYAFQLGGGWLTSWTYHPDASIASVTRIEALGFAGISPDEETAILAFVNASPGKPLLNNLHELEMRTALRQKSHRGELIQTEAEKGDSHPSLAKRWIIPIFFTWKR